MKNIPILVKVGIAFILVNALILLVFGVILAAGLLHPAIPYHPAVEWVLIRLSIVAGLVLAFLSWLLYKRVKFAWYAAVASCALLVLVTFADDVGAIDIAYAVIALVPLVLLIRDRKWYLGGVKNGGDPRED